MNLFKWTCCNNVELCTVNDGYFYTVSYKKKVKPCKYCKIVALTNLEEIQYKLTGKIFGVDLINEDLRQAM